jgi:hypothetical protein
MSCGRCGAAMLKTELYLSETKVKTVSAWRCDHCGRIEYYTVDECQKPGRTASQ